MTERHTTRDTANRQGSCGLPTQRGFIMPSPTLIMAGVIVALSLSNVAFIHLYRSGVAAHAKFKADVSAQQDALKAEEAAKLRASEQASIDATIGWAAASDALARRPVIRVRHNCDSPSLPSLPGTATSVAGLQASESGLGAYRTITSEECEARINGSVKDAIWIETVKAWVSSQHEVSK